VWTRLVSYGTRLMKGIEEVAKDAGIEVLVNGVPEMFQLLFTHEEEVHEYRDLAKCDLNRYAALHVELMNHGVMIDEDNMECFFTCAAHDNADLDATIAALSRSLADVDAGIVHIPEQQERRGA
jgi:glutamate-1-semialdehyde 2,1-aminomutase